MHINKIRTFTVAAAIAFTGLAIADHNPQHERDELMESVGDAAKPIGGMFKGEIEYDADAVMASLQVWHEVGGKFGDLFPEGSESGEGTEAAPAIWEDRDGFNAALADWRKATDAAIDAAPQSLDAAKESVGPVFETCKGCHDTYRIKDE